MVSSLVKWLRAVGSAGLFLGVVSIMLANYFWVGVVLAYVGLAALIIDVWFEPDFRGHLRRKIVVWLVLVVLAGIFSWMFVFVPSPLNLLANMTDGTYPEGVTISGIPWKPQFTEVAVYLKNGSGRDYEGLNFTLRPTSAVAAIAEHTQFGCTFRDRLEIDPHIYDIKEYSTRNSTVIPLVILATTEGYRMRCPKLPAGATIEVTVALADVKWDPKPQPLLPIGAVVRDPNYIMKLTGDDFGIYWLGYKDGDVFATRPISWEWIMVEGDYQSMYRKRHIRKKIEYGGRIPARPPL
jgi:hypothetical protein